MSKKRASTNKIEPIDNEVIFEVEGIVNKRIIAGKVSVLFRIFHYIVDCTISLIELYDKVIFWCSTGAIFDQVQRLSRLRKYMGTNRKLEVRIL